MSSGNLFAVLEDVNHDNVLVKKSQPKKEQKVEPKQAPKTQQQAPKKPQETKKEKKQNQSEGFEQVGAQKKGGKKQQNNQNTNNNTSAPKSTNFKGNKKGDVPTKTKDIRKDEVEGGHKPKKFVKPRTAKHDKDHHVSGTGIRKNVKKQGGGSHNWGQPEKDVEVALDVEPQQEETATEEVAKVEEAPKQKDIKDMTPEEKKEYRRKKKEEEKKAKKAQGKKDDKKAQNSNDVSYDSIVETKEDPNAKTFEEYQKELQEKKKQLKGTSDEEPKEEKKQVQKKEEKKGLTASDLFKAPAQNQQNDQKNQGQKKKKPKTTKKAPNVNDKSAFPALKF